ncbi:MAG: ABC transporter permease [Bacteroidales bacterium]|jgi:putative ABC transport system permease protein|nr:ABC transporter permease [Bacteroidales bacterium]
MFDLDKWQQIYSVLKKNKLRTFLTAFGVFWGIFMLMIMIGAGTGLRNGITQGFGDFATNSFFMWTQRTTVSYKGFPKGRYYNFETSDINALKENIAGIEYIAPKLQAGSYNSANNNVVRGLKTGAFNINGDYPAFNKIDPCIMLKGRFINKLDINKKRKVAVIGERVEEELFDKEENPIGEYIKINGVYFQVVGVSKPLNPNINFGGDKQRSVVVPFTTFQQVYNYGDVVGFFAITAKKGISVSNIENQAMQLMKRKHSISPDDDRAIGHINIEKEYKKMTGLFNGIGILIWIVGIGTLLAGVIGVSNIMLIVVRERTKEIGIQRALGATPMDIIKQILNESVVLTLFSGYVGLIFSVGVIELLNIILINSDSENEMFKNPEINFNIAIASIFILVIFGALAGLLPANRAVSIKPIEALRDE